MKGYCYVHAVMAMVLIHMMSWRDLASVHTNHYIRRFLSNSSSARCLDGTIPAYYIRRSNSFSLNRRDNRWLLHFEHGGWCYTLSECHYKSRTYFGSSIYDYDNNENRFVHQVKLSYLMDDKVVNPMFHNWNVVYIRYCDGTSFTGHSTHEFNKKKLYFHGQVNRDETIRQLLNRDGMHEATEIVVTGCSSAGLAIYYGIDAIADIIHTHHHHHNQHSNHSRMNGSSYRPTVPLIHAMADSS